MKFIEQREKGQKIVIEVKTKAQILNLCPKSENVTIVTSINFLRLR